MQEVLNMEMDLDIDLSGLNKIADQINLSIAEKQQITEQGARQAQLGIQDSLKSKTDNTGGSKPHTTPDGTTFTNRQQHFLGLENVIKLHSPENMAATDVEFPSEGYYWKFVDEGHFVVDNRPHFVNSTGRNYRYKLKTVDSGSRSFQGLHFVDQGVEEKRAAAVEDMRKAFIAKLHAKGL
ncbi:hypothetical protein HMPREF0877_0169 [Weissella paramesenteroides ATCC 33313]|uniref:Uncharacterized protein n=2 Tax=Weissella paramesenteroides TaxID=1249 RepID=C5R874_WEIPA|nr:hypothetical protein HMPREF0877_0169 [Weissella paramesenteroides ATCC 33313]